MAQRAYPILKALDFFIILSSNIDFVIGKFENFGIRLKNNILMIEMIF